MFDVEARADSVLLRMEDGGVNAMSQPFVEGFATAWNQALEEERPIILTGNDRVFSAGLDLKTLPELDEPGLIAFFRGFVDLIQQVATASVPTLAAVNGPAIAGGAVLALATDLRFVNQDARMALTEVTVGVPYPPVALEICEQALPQHEHAPALLAAMGRQGEELVAHGWAHEYVRGAHDRLVGEAKERAKILADHDARTFAEVKQALGQRRAVSGSVPDEAIETYVSDLLQASSLEGALERAQQR